MMNTAEEIIETFLDPVEEDFQNAVHDYLFVFVARPTTLSNKSIGQKISPKKVLMPLPKIVA